MNKRIFIKLILCFVITALTAQNHYFNVGDVISGIKKNPPKHTIKIAKIFDMPEGTLEVKSYKETPSEKDTNFLFAGGQLIGVSRYEKGQELFFLDMNGDGTIQIISHSPVIPLWVLSISNHTKKSEKNNVDKILNSFYDIFNGNDNPYESGKLNKLIKENFELAVNIDTENRDLIYGICLYYGYNSQKNHYLNYANVQNVLLEYLYRFKLETAHPLIFLWALEENLGIKNKEYVIELLPTLIDTFPEFIPFKVYSWQLENDPKLKEQKYKELKKKYSKHWIVKQI
ncbi:hypothetical protein [Treponema pedis]|uniref:Uncharacterized protein n=1 Tax=Treponema pedis str. T A4 TaxID=1291379 RepID=S5ZZB1_9SPIR|nr:hypothetical protein [Treponema pedis]AGT43563.1 hypothetical protein TPE_1067 [Treponema pedis str. T A4]